MIKSINTLLATATLSAHAAWADPTPLATVESQTFSGNCGPVTYDVAPQGEYTNALRNVRGESLRLFFSDFYVQAENPGDYLRTCDINARINVPAGYRFMPVRANAEGFYQISPEGKNTGGIKVSYTVQPGNLNAYRTNPKPFTGNGDIHCKADLEKPSYTTCFNKPTQVNLSTHLAMWLNHQVNGFSTIQLDASRRDQNLFWNWQLQSCENFFDQKTFDTTYVATNGNTYHARLTVDMYQGTYSSSAGFTGTLSNLQYSEDGLTLKGNWSALGTGGSFVFNMTDVGNGHFNGSWTDHQGKKASWTGHYAHQSVPAREYHSFFTADTHQCLDSNGALNAGYPWSINNCHYAQNQQFYTPEVDLLEGFHIKSRTSGKCMVSVRHADGSMTVTQNTCEQADGAIWEFYHRGESPFKLKNVKEGLCLKQLHGGRVTLGDCDHDSTYLYWSLHS